MKKIDHLIIKVGTSTLMAKDASGHEQLDHASSKRIGSQSACFA
jgi:hypothetical protein